MSAPVQMRQQRSQADGIGDQGGRGRAGDAQARQRTPAEDEQRVQGDVQSHAEQQEQERRPGIARAAQHHHQEAVAEEEGQGEEDDAQVGQRQRQGVGGHADQPQQLRCDGVTQQRHQGGKAEEEAGAGADHALGAVDVARADGLADQNRCGHADAEDGAEQEEQDGVGVGRGGERGLAEVVADPDRIDRAVERLQHVAGQHGQGEAHQGGADAALGQIARCVRGGGHGDLRRGGKRARFCGPAAVTPVTAVGRRTRTAAPVAPGRPAPALARACSGRRRGPAAAARSGRALPAAVGWLA